MKRNNQSSTFVPIVWHPGSIIRLGVAFVTCFIALLYYAIALLFGYQKHWPNITGYIRDFVFLYPALGWRDVGNPIDTVLEQAMVQKVFRIRNRLISIPISIVGIAIQIVVWMFCCHNFMLMFSEHQYLISAFGYYIASAFWGAVGLVHLGYVVDTMSYEKTEKWIRKYFGRGYYTRKQAWYSIIFFLVLVYLAFFILLQIVYHTPGIRFMFY